MHSVAQNGPKMAVRYWRFPLPSRGFCFMRQVPARGLCRLPATVLPQRPVATGWLLRGSVSALPEHHLGWHNREVRAPRPGIRSRGVMPNSGCSMARQVRNSGHRSAAAFWLPLPPRRTPCGAAYTHTAGCAADRYGAGCRGPSGWRSPSAIECSGFAACSPAANRCAQGGRSNVVTGLTQATTAQHSAWSGCRGQRRR